MIRGKTMFYVSVAVLLTGVLLMSIPVTTYAQGTDMGEICISVTDCATGKPIDGAIVAPVTCGEFSLLDSEYCIR